MKTIKIPCHVLFLLIYIDLHNVQRKRSCCIFWLLQRRSAVSQHSWKCWRKAVCFETAIWSSTFGQKVQRFCHYDDCF